MFTVYLGIAKPVNLSGTCVLVKTFVYCPCYDCYTTELHRLVVNHSKLAMIPVLQLPECTNLVKL